MSNISQNYSFEVIELKLSVFVETDLSLSKQNEICLHFYQKLIKKIMSNISQNNSFEAIELKFSTYLAYKNLPKFLPKLIKKI